MPNYAILEGSTVINVIVADTAEVAEGVTGNPAVESTDANPASIGGAYDSVKGKFIAVKPFASWVLDSNDVWQAPVAKPTDDQAYTWNEETHAWDVVTPA